MTLKEFQRTRVTMTVEQYKAVYDGDFDDTIKETAKMHVYKDGLYLRELLNGFYCSDLGDTLRVQKMETAEEIFWNSFANETYNPKLPLPAAAKELLLRVKYTTSELMKYWLNEEDDIQQLLSEHYPKNLPDFEELTALIQDWAKETVV